MFNLEEAPNEMKDMRDSAFERVVAKGLTFEQVKNNCKLFGGGYRHETWDKGKHSVFYCLGDNDCIIEENKENDFGWQLVHINYVSTSDFIKIKNVVDETFKKMIGYNNQGGIKNESK